MVRRRSVMKAPRFRTSPGMGPSFLSFLVVFVLVFQLTILGADPTSASLRTNAPRELPVVTPDGGLLGNGNATSGSTAESPHNAKRQALVVGCDYPGTKLALPSPVKDAHGFAAMLKDTLGFEVVLKINPNRRELLEAMDSLGESLKQQSGVGLFYFSGHGAQHEGANYLIPAGAHLKYQEDLPTEAVAAQMAVTRMEAAGNGLNLVFLEACRDHSLPSARTKSVGPAGLQPMRGSGTLIGFAADAGAPAYDSGAGSYYTNALLRHLPAPGISVVEALTRVRKEVKETVSHEKGEVQEPFVYLGLDDLFTFLPGSPTPETPPSKPPFAKPGFAMPAHPAAVNRARAARKAIVIGNVEYPDPILHSVDSVRDAKLMAETFSKLRFSIHKGGPLVNLTRDEILSEVELFVESLQPEDEAIFYFSGQGVSLNGLDYVVPSDFKLEPRGSVPLSRFGEQAVAVVNLSRMLSQPGCRLVVMFLDCSRDTPHVLDHNGDRVAEGEAKWNNSSGANEILICFSTEPGGVSWCSSDGTTSPYTTALAEEILRPLEIQTVMKNVARRVYEEATSDSERQKPWTHGVLLRDHFLAGAPIGK